MANEKPDKTYIFVIEGFYFCSQKAVEIKNSYYSSPGNRQISRLLFLKHDALAI